MESSKRVKLSLRVNKEKKTGDKTTTSEILDEKAKFYSDRCDEVPHTDSNGRNENSKRNVSVIQSDVTIATNLTTDIFGQLLKRDKWTPLPDIKWKKSSECLDSILPSSAGNAEDIDMDESKTSSGWTPLPAPCLRCLCGKKRRLPRNTGTELKKPELENDFTASSSTASSDICIGDKEGVSRNIKTCSSTPNMISLKKSKTELNSGSAYKQFPSATTSDSHRLSFPEHSNASQSSHSSTRSELSFLPNRNSTTASKAHFTSTGTDRNIVTPQYNKFVSSRPLNLGNSSSNTANSSAVVSCNSSRTSLERHEGSNPMSDSKRQLINDKVENVTLLLQQCPLCALEFDASLGQIERDSHLAACIAAADEDIFS